MEMQSKRMSKFAKLSGTDRQGRVCRGGRNRKTGCIIVLQTEVSIFLEYDYLYVTRAT